MLKAITGGISRLFSRSIENPANALEDYDTGTGSLSPSGVIVNRERALKHPPFWRAVNMLSADCAKLPIYTYRRVDGGKVQDLTHPAHRLFRVRPNPFQTPFDFVRQIVAQSVSTGNGYAYVDRDNAGRPVALLVLDSMRVVAVRADGMPWYVYSVPNSAEKRRIPGHDIIHLQGLSLDGMAGLDVNTYIRDAIGHGIAAQAFGAKFFANSARPNVALMHPGKLTAQAQANILNSWSAMHQGLDNAHKSALLCEGMDVKTLSINARDSQLIESVRWSIIDVANFFGIPPHKLGDTSANSYNSRTEENQAYLDQALNPILVQLEWQLKTKLLTESELDNETHTIDVQRYALEQANLEARTAYYTASLAGAAWMTVDEIRRAEGMNTVGGDNAEIQQPTNNFAGEPEPPDDTPDDTEDPPAQDPPATDGRSIAPIVAQARDDAAARIIKRLSVHMEKCNTIEEMYAFAATVDEKHMRTCRDIAATADAVSRHIGMMPNLSKWMIEGLQQYIRSATTIEQARAAVEQWKEEYTSE
jgi:HK97 family phage portal protein